MEGKDYTCFVPVCFLVHCTFLSRTSCHLSRLPQSPQTNEFPEKPNRMRLSHMLLLPTAEIGCFLLLSVHFFPRKNFLRKHMVGEPQELLFRSFVQDPPQIVLHATLYSGWREKTQPTQPQDMMHMEKAAAASEIFGGSDGGTICMQGE